MDREEQDLAWSIYMGALDFDSGYYADQAEEPALLAVYKAGIEVGKKQAYKELSASSGIYVAGPMGEAMRKFLDYYASEVNIPEQP
jgi:hypothetical protein